MADGSYSTSVAGILAAIVLFVLGYTIADRRQSSRAGEIARCLLVGLNAGINAVLLGWVTFWPVGLAGATVNALAALPLFSRNRTYQSVLAWTSWLLPMSWPGTGAGLLLASMGLLVHPLHWLGFRVPHIQCINIGWRTGTVNITGSTTVPIRAWGFDLGNIIFLQPDGQTAIPHEVGHALNVAAFGWIFHCIGAIDQNVPPFRRRFDAYAEHLAESYRSPGDTPLPSRMWG